MQHQFFQAGRTLSSSSLESNLKGLLCLKLLICTLKFEMLSFIHSISKYWCKCGEITQCLERHTMERFLD